MKSDHTKINLLALGAAALILVPFAIYLWRFDYGRGEDTRAPAGNSRRAQDAPRRQPGTVAPGNRSQDDKKRTADTLEGKEDDGSSLGLSVTVVELRPQREVAAAARIVRAVLTNTGSKTLRMETPDAEGGTLEVILERAGIQVRPRRTAIGGSFSKTLVELPPGAQFAATFVLDELFGELVSGDYVLRVRYAGSCRAVKRSRVLTAPAQVDAQAVSSQIQFAVENAPAGEARSGDSPPPPVDSRAGD